MRGIVLGILLLLGATVCTGAGVFPIFTTASNANTCWTVNPTTGWTNPCPTTSGTGTACSNSSSTYTGTCVVYVSSSTSGASDSTCAAQTAGSSPQTVTPTASTVCQTIHHAVTLLRATSADWLLLKTGDTFSGTGQDFYNAGLGSGGLCNSGISSTQPLLISSYGSGANPIVEANPANNPAVAMYSSGSCHVDVLAVIGITFYGATNDPNNAAFDASTPTNAIQLQSPFTWLLFENNLFSFNSIDIDSSGASTQSTNLTIRRNVIVDVYSTVGHASGAYISATTNVTLYENVWDHNGWNATVSGGGMTFFNHNIYLECGNPDSDGCNQGTILVSGNLSTNAGGDQFRSGGTIQDNAWFLDPYGFTYSTAILTGAPGSSTLATVNPLVQWNYFGQQVNLTANGGDDTVDDEIGAGPNTKNDSGQSVYGTATNANNLFAYALLSSTSAAAINIDPNQVGTILNSNIACAWNTDGGYVIWDQDTSTFGTGANVNQVNTTTCGTGGTWTNGNGGSISTPSFPDPYRSPGSFVACMVAGGSACSPYTLSGVSANATFTGVIASGVLTATGCTPSCVSGTINVSDAITWSGQTAQDFVVSVSCASGTCTATLAGTESVASTSMSSWTSQQFIGTCSNGVCSNGARGNNKANWNPGLTAPALVAYEMAGVGKTSPFSP